MLYLKAANLDDWEKEYDFITNTPEDENGFTNSNFGCTKEEFKNQVLPQFIDQSKGINLPDGYVPGTEYFLWDDDQIVGLFRIRHYLKVQLKNGAYFIVNSLKK